MHKTRLHIIRIFALLLLLCGAANDAWAQKKVTYHILTLPFTVRNYNNTGDFRTNIRVEALQCTSQEDTLGLPDQFKSPLAKNFRYWKTATSTYGHLYDYTGNSNVIEAKYYIYQCTEADKYACLSNELTVGTSTGADDFPSDIYVTYEYNDTNSIMTLDGTKDYNVSVNVSGKQRFMAYNRSRNNRVANALSTGLTGEDLASDDFVIPENGNRQLGWAWATWGPKGVHLGFKFEGADPYNITITTSYMGEELHITDAITNVDNTGTIKPYAGATLFGKINNTSMWFDASNNKHYKLESGIKSAGAWTDAKYAECKARYIAASDAARYDTWVGFYRKEFPTINAYALLPHPSGEYMFVGSKMNQGNKSSTKPTINQPNSSGQYATYNDNSNNPYFKFQAFSSAYKTNFYEIRTYTLKVITHGSGTVLTKTMKWSDARASENIVDHVPEALKRKYVQFTGAYSDANKNKTNAITTFADALAANNGNVIWLDYETDTEAAPFEFLPEGGDYKNAHWYTMRVNGKAEQKNIAYNSSNDLITGSPSIGSESDLHKGENSANAQVAFMGDPYELKIISRAASEAATFNRYVGIGAGATVGTTLNTNKTASDSITWEIMYESSDAGNFVLRRFKTVDNPKYIGWSTTGNKPVIYSSDSTRIRVVDLNKVNYTYHIMRSNGSIAIKATVSEYVGKPLQSWMDIPTIIRSPFLATATVNYYATSAHATTDNPTNKITNAPYDYTTNNDIYVRYSFATAPTGGTFNVTLNAEFIYTSATPEDANIYSKGSLIKEGDIDDAANPHYQWALNYSDPYAMTIQNIGNIGKGKYVKLSSATPTNNKAFSWDNAANATLFIAKQSAGNPGFYEVMLATGEDYDAGDGVGVTTTYFNVGRNISSTSENTVKLYQNTTYASGYNQLRFRLIGTEARDIVYHLIDKANHDLLQVTWRHMTEDEPYFPPRYRSPLVSTYYYWSNSACTTPLSNNKIGQVGDVYVTYDVNNLVNLKRGKLYLLKYEAGQMFNEEDGSDGISKTARKAIYPYVNGDCNFFVYGQEQYDLQQEGAASTRTRWAWYVQSDVGAMGDPYHVKIRSRQSESYPYTNPSEYNAYFATYQPTGYSKVVTTLTWPGISGIDATEYMVLGNEGQYQLVTTNEINGSRYTVNSFEQYWKTWDTIRKKVYGDKDAKADPNDSITIPRLTKAKFGSSTSKLLRDSLVAAGWHCYENWAYAKRWNGYNNGYNSTDGTPKASKGWEKVEHWYQTVSMGEGYFDFVETSITPVLILLDQHGWEIMRKPLPSSPTDPQKEAKYEVIRPYNSPMVKEYAFWATAKKRSGFHQYYLLSDRIGGDDFTSTDLTNLPPYGSKNVLDKKGNLNDQYVTYIVKDEYAQTYSPSTNTGKEFLIEQGSKYASTSDGTTITKNNVPAGGMVAHITNDEIPDTEKWYIKPNSKIDIEMGYNDVSHSWTGADQKNPNAYDYWRYKDSLVATYIDKKAIQDSLGYFSFSNGFDPYNIQIMPKSYETNPRKFIKTNATGAVLYDGVMNGVYKDTEGNPVAPATSLGDSIPTVDKNNCIWFDSRKLSVTNATWMAVQDANGNMQLMPRFDHNLRMSEFGDLIAPTSADAAKTYTKLYRPVVYDYRFIDNEGHESIRYKSGGDLLPQTPDRFKSPFATNLTYYADAECTDEITESLDGATLTDSKVYVRYEYDEEADDQKILMGKWQTMKLNDKDVQYTTVSSTAGIYYDAATSKTKPSPVDGDDKKWQWKFLETPQSTPDPYAVKIYSRDKTDGAVMTSSYALLPHIVDGVSDGYMLTCMDGSTDFTYSALTGDSDNSTAAANSTDNSTNIAAGTDYDTKCKILLADDVEHTFTYKVYTNSGAFAISANQTQEDVNSNDWETRIPDEIKTPLLNLDQFRYYSKDNVTFDAASPEPNIARADTTGKNLTHLYGLYDDEVVVRYTPYDPSVTDYMVPNVRNATTESTVAKGIGSNDAPLDLTETLIYNVIWFNDNMMFTSDNSNVVGEADKNLQTDNRYEWKIGGNNDPYAMTFLNVSAEKYITAASAANNTDCSLTDNATKFMLLPKDGYEYGMLAITGNEGSNLTIPDDDAAKITTGDPAQFIFFALATHKVIYHLMIKNIGEDIIIPYKTNNELNNYYKIRTGSTMRDLTTKDQTGGEAGHIAGDYYQLGESLKAIGNRDNNTTGLFARDSIYCYDAGHISLGDELEVPSVFYRPNVNYFFIVEGVYDSTGSEELTTMNDRYKGVMTTNMGDDPGLLGSTVFVNIVYSFDTGLSTNAGSDFVRSVNQNMWYTFETSDATPRLAEFTGELKTTSGYATHYTNDYLWTPVGDPYGFKMYNRYLYKNLKQLTQVMTTASIASGQAVVMGTEASNGGRDIYELITTSTTTPGYFRVHPMVNKSGTQYYMNSNSSTGALTLSTVPSEWTFGLNEEVMRPYYQAAGYVGGLNEAGKAAYETAVANQNEFTKLTTLQDVVYNHDNDGSDPDNQNPNYIVHYAPGYYRLHSQPGSSGITTQRYASGYTHRIELTAGDGDTAIPLHFYEKTSYDVNNPDFTDLDRGGFTVTPATRGEIPLSTVNNDAASIFLFTGDASASPTSTVQTQGLYVKNNKMTATAGEATTFTIVDIGAGIVALQNGENFLKYAQDTVKYDLKFDNKSATVESARWCMQPVQKGATAGSGEMPLTLIGNNGYDKHFYTTFYAPFDALLTNAATDTAFVVPAGQWPTITPPATIGIMHPKEIGEYNTAENGCPEAYRGSSQFIPANTPVIIRSKSTSSASTSNINLALPTTTPSDSVSCVFSGVYLEQSLPQSYDYNSDHSIDYVYVFGLEYDGTYTEDPNFATNGEIHATAPSPTKVLGFFKNMNRDRESADAKNSWKRNNKYVFGNKIYYREGPVNSGGAREFIPVVFDFSDGEEFEEQISPSGERQAAPAGDGCIYDLQGRLVATKDMVEDGSWQYRLSPGIYILNGKKFTKR